MIIKMSNLPEKTSEIQKVALAVYNPKGTTAIEIRRQMVNVPEVARTLSEVERYVFAASTKKLIGEMDDDALVEATKKMFRFIAMDVGFKIPDTDDWTYICTRLFVFLKKYYSTLTLADVKLAFELVSTGDLDEHFEKKEDKNHYQQFNTDYFAKILNAYKSKRTGVISKAYKAIPAPEKKVSTDEIVKNHNRIVDRCKTIFLKYKYLGLWEMDGLEHMFVYDWLLRSGLADQVKGSLEDREHAYRLYMKRVSDGFYNKYRAVQVRKEGIESSALDFTAFEIARIKEIRRAFDEMIKEGVYVNQYLDYK